jgi:hypothetical protein
VVPHHEGDPFAWFDPAKSYAKGLVTSLTPRCLAEDRQ